MQNTELVVDQAVAKGTEIVIEKGAQTLGGRFVALPLAGKVGIIAGMAGAVAAAGYGVYRFGKFLIKKFSKKPEVKAEETKVEQPAEEIKAE